jgi:hypothetical protein
MFSLKTMCLRASYKKKICLHPKNQWRKESDPKLDPNPDPLVRGTDPAPHQNVTDPQHCSQDYFQKPQRICKLMNSALAYLYSTLLLPGIGRCCPSRPLVWTLPLCVVLPDSLVPASHILILMTSCQSLNGFTWLGLEKGNRVHVFK